MTDTIPSITEEILAGINDSFGSLFLVQRVPPRGPHKSFRTISVEIGDDIAGEFKESARRALEDVANNRDRITKFSDPSNANSYVAMDRSTLPQLDALLVKLEHADGFHGSRNFSDVKDKGISCLVLKSGDRRVFVFHNVGKNNNSPDKYIVGRFGGGGLSLNTDKLVVFEKHVFAIYYEDLGQLLIVSYRSAKKLLGFKEQFRSTCRTILTKKLKSLVSFENVDPEALLTSAAVNEKMVKMHGRGAFNNPNPEVLKKWNRFYKKTHLDGTSLVKTDSAGKAVVNDRDSLEMLLHIMSHDVVEPVTLRKTYALATSKKNLRASGNRTPLQGGHAG